MGIYLFSRYRGPEICEVSDPIPLGNPNPRRFQIVKTEAINNHLIAEIKYPDCNNFEGNKILLFENLDFQDLVTRDHIDPHFTDEKQQLCPVARFIPTVKGWEMARALANSMR